MSFGFSRPAVEREAPQAPGPTRSRPDDVTDHLFSADSVRAAFVAWLEDGGVRDTVRIGRDESVRTVEWLLNRLMGEDALTRMSPEEWRQVNHWIARRQVAVNSLRDRALNLRPVTYGQAAELMLAVRKVTTDEGEFAD